MSVKRIDIQKYCAACGREFAAEDERVVCPDDDALLMPLKHDPLVGQLVASKFEILELIGCGGWGWVYKARDIKLNRLVAFKVMRADLASTAEKLQRFEREARLMSSLSHPHICSVYDCGILENGQPFLVLEYLTGETLEDVITFGTPSVACMVPLMKEIAQAVAAAHAQGIVHRDLKPANIMVVRDKDGAASTKIIDFGLAKTYETLMPEQLTRTGMTIGTPTFMSPEQVMGGQLDGRSDVYSFGCVLYQTLTGKPAVTGRNVFEVMQNHLSAVRSRDDFDDTVPNALKDLTLDCLKQDISQRYQSMNEVAEDLESLQNGGKIKPRRRISSRQRRGLAITAAVLGFSGIVIAVSFITNSLMAPDAESAKNAEQQRFERQVQSISALSADGQTDKAVAEGELLIADLKKRDMQNSPSMVLACNAMIETLQSDPQRKLEAVPYVKARLEAKKHLFAPDSEEYLEAAKEAATAAKRLEDKDRLPYIEEVLALTKQKYGTNSKEVAEPLGALAWDQFELGNPQESIRLYKQLVPLVDRFYKPRDHMWVAVRGELTWIYCNTGDYNQARILSEQALPFMSDATNPRFRLDFLGSSALAQRRCGNFDRAIELTKQAVSLATTLDARQSINLKGELGRILFEAKRYKEAEPILLESLKNIETTSGSDGASYRVILGDYAELLRRTARAARADEVEAAGKV